MEGWTAKPDGVVLRELVVSKGLLNPNFIPEIASRGAAGRPVDCGTFDVPHQGSTRLAGATLRWIRQSLRDNKGSPSFLSGRLTSPLATNQNSPLWRGGRRSQTGWFSGNSSIPTSSETSAGMEWRTATCRWHPIALEASNPRRTWPPTPSGAPKRTPPRPLNRPLGVPFRR